MNTIITPLQRLIDRTGMYRVVTSALLFLVVCSLFFAVAGVSTYSFSEQIISLVLLLAAALLTNFSFSKVLNVAANHESAVITSLILFFLFTPPFSSIEYGYLAGVAAIAMASKYIIVWRKQHILNPVAIGAIALSLTGIHEAWWWIASPEMFLPLVLAGGIVVTKVRRWSMFGTLVGVGMITLVLQQPMALFDMEVWYRFFVTGPLLFLGFFMLTEPFTTPPTKQWQLMYAAIVGFLANTTIFAPLFGMTPELALVIGNIMLYPTLLKQKLFLKLIERKSIAKNTWEMVFKKPAGFQFQSGQYLEWMLPHEKSDTRGIRRYFTIASAPQEEDVRLAYKTVEGGSSYKQQLLAMQPDDTITASQLSGDFLLPKDTSKKIACIAGGIGVTPFRSFVGQLLTEQDHRDLILFYANNHKEDIAYQEKFDEAQKTLDMKLVHVLSGEEVAGYESGYVDANIITKHTPDYRERIWYVSGPPVMVDSCVAILKKLGVSQKHIVTDFFPGLA